MPEKEPRLQFNKSEAVPGSAPEKEKELIERKKWLGKEAEWDLALPLLKDLIKKGVLTYAEHTTKEVDEGEGGPKVDFVVGLKDGSHLAISFSISESEAIQEEKIRKIISYGRPYEKLKDIHPKPRGLTRLGGLEKVLKIALFFDWDTVDTVYKRFEESGQQELPFELLPEKRKIEIDLLHQIRAALHHFFTDKEMVKLLARIDPDLPSIAEQRYKTLHESFLKFIKKEEQR